MTVIRPNSISGITSLTAHRGSIDFYAHDGSAATFNNINSNVTSGVSTFASLNITGDLDVGGALTYEDVTNIDSVGVITARNGLHVTGGRVGIGTDVPEDELHLFLSSSSDGPSLRLTNPNGGDGTYTGRISTGDAAGTFFAGINFLKHDSNDGEIRFRTKVNGSNQDTVTIVDGNIGIGINNPTERLHLIGGSSSSAGTQVDIVRLVASDFSPTNSGGLTIGAVWHNTDVSRRISYLQSSQNLDSGSTNRALCLNPNGGSIGIGTNNPVTKLDVVTELDVANVLRVRNETQSLNIGVNNDDGGSFIFESLNNALRFGTNDIERLRITSSGNIGIGTDNPVGSLEVRDSKANLIVAKDGLTVKSNSDLHTSYDTLQLGAGGALLSYSIATVTADTQFVHNAYRSSGGTFKYRYADTSARIRMNSPGGEIIFDNAASGSADADITFSERLRITSGGNVGINTNNPTTLLEIGDSHYDSNLTGSAA